MEEDSSYERLHKCSQLDRRQLIFRVSCWLREGKGRAWLEPGREVYVELSGWCVGKARDAELVEARKVRASKPSMTCRAFVNCALPRDGISNYLSR